jgi:ParB/RepB/Spo0J family partition protein
MKKKNSEDVLGPVLMIPWLEIRPFADQPRKFFDREQLEKLAKSIKKNGQEDPGKIRKLPKPEGKIKYELVDGQRRWHAVQIAGKQKFKAWVIQVNDEKQQFIKSLVLNCHRVDHSPMEYALAIDKMRKWGMDLGDISEIFGKTAGWVSQYHSLLRLETEVTDLMHPSIPEEKRLGFSTALMLVGIPADVQKALAKKICDGQLSWSKSKHLIKKTIHNKGIVLNKRRIRPSRYFGQLVGFIKRTNSEINDILDTPVPHFKETLSGGDERQQAELLRLIIESTEQFVALRQFVERTIAANKQAATSPKK